MTIPTSDCHMNCHRTATTNDGTIQGVSISYNETDGMLTGNMTMNTYYLLGTDKVYSSPYIPDMQMGVDTIFGNVE